MGTTKTSLLEWILTDNRIYMTTNVDHEQIFINSKRMCGIIAHMYEQTVTILEVW